MAKKKEMCSLENHEPGAGIVLMKLEELHSFEGHPFKVERNQELFELRCSIEKEGVLVPLLVRKNPHGDGYEIIAGHRRKEAALWAGLTEVPVIIREAETVRLIYDMYLQGNGCGTIAKRLVELGIKNKRGTVEWHDHGVMGMIKNEKYKGDVLLGKTFTVDPISKRRLANMGEENQYYIRDHHEAIVSREIWDKAEEIRLKRAKPKLMQTTGNRERYTRQFTFSSMLECGYCGHKLSRRTRHQTTTTKKPVWQCMNATKNGIDNCPNCKAVDEVIIENAFLEAFRLLADSFDDVLQSVLNTIEDILKDDTELKRVKQLEKDISTIESKKSRLTDLLIDGKIEQEDYDEKKLSFQRKLHKITEEKAYLEENIGQQKNISRRMSQLRQTLENENALDEFDRIVFESIVEKVIVGGYDAEGNPTPYKLTFVLKCNQTLKVDNAKADYRANQKGKKVS